MRILLYTPVFAEMDAVMRTYPEHLECGGQFYGYTPDPETVCVVRAFPPGKGFKPNPDTFGDDLEDVWAAFRAYYDQVKFGGYVGHWHTHPMPPPVRRSRGDTKNGKWLFAWCQEQKKPAWALGTLIAHRHRGRVSWGAWIYNAQGDHKARIEEWDGSYQDEGGETKCLTLSESDSRCCSSSSSPCSSHNKSTETPDPTPPPRKKPNCAN